MAYGEQEITVYTVLGHETVSCEYGEHGANIVVVKRLSPVVGQREYDNGYEKRMTDLRVDAQGRTYHQHIEIDYFNNTSWVRVDDGVRFRTSMPYGEVAFDYAGRRLQ